MLFGLAYVWQQEHAPTPDGVAFLAATPHGPLFVIVR